jgi:hypothetical protein
VVTTNVVGKWKYIREIFKEKKAKKGKKKSKKKKIYLGF